MIVPPDSLLNRSRLTALMAGLLGITTLPPAYAQPAECALPYTRADEIQGSGPSAALTGTVTTQGVVIGDYELPPGSGQIRGFYLQDPTGDGNPATSDGLLVFTGGTDRVSLGQLVRVTGTAGEFQDQTQISHVSALIPCGTGSVAPIDITLPLTRPDDLERFEGMRVRFPQTLFVTEHFQLGRFGQVVVSSGGRLRQPTQSTLPGAAAHAVQAANDLNRLLIDDASNTENPDPILFGRQGNPLSAGNTLRGGDTVTGLTGVLVYGWAGSPASPNAYRVRPVNALGGGVPNFQPANPRPAVPASVGGTLRVTGFNLLSYFNTFDGPSGEPPYACHEGIGGPLTDCRGADDISEFARQSAKTVAALVGLNADILGVIEVENDGYGPDSALQDLVNRLNGATAPGTYAFIDVDAATGQINALGRDAIKVGLLYKPGQVTPVGQTAVLNTTAFVTGGDSTPRNRPALAQAFEQLGTGERVVISVNHLKSKGSPCDTPDANDGQGNCNSVRTHAAQALVAWLASNPTGTGDSDSLILGDLNAYAMEDPITAIRNAGYTNLIQSLVGEQAYSYAFNGQWGYLDHALSSASLTPQVTGITEWHINADEPAVLDYNTNFKSTEQLASLYSPDPTRVSDHDPVLVGLTLKTPPPNAQ